MTRSLMEELRNELFPPEPAKIKPNTFAVFTRWIWRNAGVVLFAILVVSCLALAALMSGGKLLANEGNGTGVSAPSSVKRLQTISLSNASSAELRLDRADFAQTLRSHDEIYTFVFAPGEGEFYENNALLYRPLEEVKSRVNYGLSLKPLFTALSAQPDSASMAKLVTAMRGAVEQGRQPEGLEGLLEECAKAIAALMKSEDGAVDWANIAELSTREELQSATLIAEMRPGQEAAARALVADTIIKAQANSSTRISVSQVVDEAVEQNHMENTAVNHASAAVIAAVLSGIVLAICFGNWQLSFVTLLPAAMSFLISFTCARFFFVSEQIWPFGFALAATGLQISLCCVFLVSGSQRTGSANPAASETLAMWAAQQHGRDIAKMIVVSTAIWVGLAALAGKAAIGLALLASFACLIAGVLGAVMALAMLRFLPKALNWPAAEWLGPAHLRMFETFRWRIAQRFLCAVLAIAGVVTAMSPAPKTSPSSGNLPVAIVAGDLEEAKTNIARLAAFRQAGSVRWLGMFMPTEVDEKRAALKPLADQFPRISPPSSRSIEETKAGIETMQEDLRSLAAIPKIAPELKAAADEFRRSLAILSATGTDQQVKQLENRLFGGFNRLADRADNLANLGPLDFADLPQDMRQLFGSASGPLRLFVEPAQGVSSSELATALEQAGFSTDYAGRAGVGETMAARAKLLRILGLGLFVSLALFLALKRDAALSFVAVCVVTAMAGFGFSRLAFDVWTTPFMAAVLASASRIGPSLLATRLSDVPAAAKAIFVCVVPGLMLAIGFAGWMLDFPTVQNGILPAGLGFALTGLAVAAFSPAQAHRETELDLEIDPTG